ncbi:MAG: hypothetical protein HZC28_03760 [Spirochaetes bacterium]|nr:hypothetical protein [Spirochaetota bacterium]
MRIIIAAGALLLLISCGDTPLSLLDPGRAEDVRMIRALCDTAVPTTGSIAANVLGINLFPLDDVRTLTELSNMSVPWIRLDIRWSDIETGDGVYDWHTCDALVHEVANQNKQILGIINHWPGWINNDYEKLSNRIERFAEAIANRYRPGGVLSQITTIPTNYGIRYWEIFNEPNLQGYGWNAPVNPAQYAIVLARANIGIHRADAAAAILMAGLSPDGYPWEKFMQMMCHLHALNCVDIINFHPYGWADRFPELIAKISNVMRPYGVPMKPVWFTEFGTSEEQMLDAILIKGLTQRGAAGGFFWFCLRDIRPDSEKYGLLRYDFSKKTAYHLFTNYLHQNGW